MDAEGRSPFLAFICGSHQCRRFNPQREPGMKFEVVPQTRTCSGAQFLADIGAVEPCCCVCGTAVTGLRVPSHTECWAHVQAPMEIDLGSQEQEVGLQNLRNSHGRPSHGRPIGWQGLLVAQPMPLLIQHDLDPGPAVPCSRPKRGSIVGPDSVLVGTDVRSAASYTDETMLLR